MKKIILLLIAGLLFCGSGVFADDVSIDSDGNMTTGETNTDGNLEVVGASGEDGIVGSATGTGVAGVYGENVTSGNYGILGDDNYGVYGNSSGGTAGYFQGNARVTGDLTVDGTVINSGNVGIGTNSPGTSLHILNSGASGQTPTNVTGLFVENSGSSNSAYVLQTATTGGGKSFSITNAGNVGIGTSSPSQLFEVEKSAGTDELIYGGNPRLFLKVPTGKNGIRIDADTTPLEIRDLNDTTKTINISSNFDVIFQAPAATVGSPMNDSESFFFNGTYWTGSSHNWQGRIFADTRSTSSPYGGLHLKTTTGTGIYIEEFTGNTGIGTTTPGQKLTVVGTIETTAGIKFPDAVQTSSAYDKAYVDALEARIADLETLLSNFTKVGNNVIITGANLHVRSGGSSTNDTVDGTGNIIIGFNEPRGTDPDKTGSHNLVVGKNHNYSSYGGIVVGQENTISAPYASVSGGEFNTASGSSSSVSGGAGNTALGIDASVSGGLSNIAQENASSVSGGQSNTASGLQSSVSGGLSRSVSGIHDWRAGTLFETQ